MHRDDTSSVAGNAFEPQSPQWRETIVDCLDRQEFLKLIGAQVTAIEPGFIEAVLSLTEYHKQHDGIVHGGVIATLADIVTGFAAYTLVADGQLTVTIDMTVSYLEAAHRGMLRAVGRVIRHGRTVSFARGEIFASDASAANERLIAIAQATFAIRQRA
ncbi:MAG: PaaI family thioesterase [Chlorobiota bacterium]|nr:MAG: PaaI family thioesterase [Chlorobiota bacterium]